MRLLRRLRHWLQREQFESELNEELAHHRELVERDQQLAGLSPEEAGRAAALQFGNTTAARESARSVWNWERAEGALQDLRYAWRGLSRNRSLVAIACLSIALSTGFGTTLFSVVNAVILQPVTVTSTEELVRFWVGSANRISWLNYKDICEGTPGVLCTGYRMEEVSWRENGEAVRVPAQAVMPNYFGLLGIHPAQGHLFDAQSVRENRDLVVVTYAFWQRRLAGDPGVIGRKIVLSGHPYTIAAVLPQGFRSIFGLGIAPAFYIPAGSAIRPPSQDRGRTEYELLGRVAAGESVASFQSRVQVQAQQLQYAFPHDNRELGRVQIWPLSRFGLLLQSEQRMTQGLVLFASLLMVFVVLLTVVACLNVAGLLISRALARQREIAVRLSLGCGKWRLAQLLFAESFLLAALGTSAGAVLSVWLARALVSIPLPFPIPFEIEIPIDGYLLAYLAFLTGMSTVIAGLAPAVQAWRIKGLGDTIRSPRSVGFRRFSTRALLTTGQVALSTVLLVATMLFLRSLWSATQVNAGFDMDRVVTVELDLRSEQLTDAEADQRQRTLVERVRGMAPVTAVSGADIVPLSMNSRVTSLEVDAGGAEPLRAKVNNNSILPGYFRVMGIPRLAGRDFVENDRQLNAAVIVNETFTRRLFPNGGAVGKRVRLPRPPQTQHEPWAEIVGVVADSRYLTLGEDPLPLVYWPATSGTRDLTIHVRTEGDAPALAKQLPVVLEGMSARVRPLRSVMAIALFPAQAAAVLLAALGLVGWALTIAGLYGVVGYSVTRRIPEIGVRVALGATPSGILRLVIREGLTIVVVGLALGLCVSALASPVVAMLLSGVDPHDLASFAVPGLVLLLTAAAAAYGPARSGTKISPMQALRTE